MTNPEQYIMYNALIAYARLLVRESRSRKWIGPDHTAYRAELRRRARVAQDMAMRIERGEKI